MIFRFQWSDSKSGNFAIRRKDTIEKKAGQEIERKNRQTTKTHFFLLIDEKDKDNLYLFYRANATLKTITYEYVYKGTNRKALNRYLTKDDIENVLQNIEKYKDKTITIQITPPKEERSEKRETKKDTYKRINNSLKKKFDKTKLEKAKKLTTERNTKIKTVKKLKQEIAKTEKGILETEREIFLTLFGEKLSDKIRKLENNDALKQEYQKYLQELITQKDFQLLLNENLNLVVEFETQREKANKRQNKNIQEYGISLSGPLL
jgi:nitrogen regulatory protein PII-like uncharacterized protein